MAKLTARDLMTAPVVTIASDASLGEAALLMLEKNVSCLPVVDQGGALLGIISHSDFTRSAARSVGLPVDSGVYIVDVTPGGGAARAGLRADDIIVGLGGEEIPNTGKLLQFLATHKPGESVGVTYFRGEDKRTGQMTLGARERR